MARIDAFVESERVGSRIPGIALALVQDGRVTAVRGYGTAGGGRPVTGSTPFPIGSLTKSFTAVLVRQLVDAGRIDADAPLQRWLPWFTMADAPAAGRITVRHLLNHTSGLSRADGLRAVLDGGDSIDELARTVAGLALTAPPGERYQYSNLNFVLLAAVVQAIERQPWSQLMRQRVFDPLQMHDSHTDFESARAAGMTALHRYAFGWPLEHRLALAPGLAPTGALAASADDMARYLSMLLNSGQGAGGTVLSPQAVATMLSPASPPGAARLLGADFAFRYGEGWFVGPFGAAPEARWHLGNLASFAAWMVLMPETRQGVVVLMNANCELPFFHADATFSRIPIGVVNLLAGRDPPQGPSVPAAYLEIDALLCAGALLAALCAWWVMRRRSIWPAVLLGSVAAAFAGAVGLMAPGWRGWLQFAPDLTAWLVLILFVLAAPALRLTWATGSRRRAARPRDTARNDSSVTPR